MNELLIGYARVSTDGQDLTAQRDALERLGVSPRRIYVDHGLTGRNRERPGLREALAACRAGDTLVVTKLDRLARSLPDARDIIDELTSQDVKLNLGGSSPGRGACQFPARRAVRRSANRAVVVSGRPVAAFGNERGGGLLATVVADCEAPVQAARGLVVSEIFTEARSLA